MAALRYILPLFAIVAHQLGAWVCVGGGDACAPASGVCCVEVVTEDCGSCCGSPCGACPEAAEEPPACAARPVCSGVCIVAFCEDLPPGCDVRCCLLIGQTPLVVDAGLAPRVVERAAPKLQGPPDSFAWRARASGSVGPLVVACTRSGLPVQEQRLRRAYLCVRTI